MLYFSIIFQNLSYIFEIQPIALHNPGLGPHLCDPTVWLISFFSGTLDFGVLPGSEHFAG